MKNFLVNLFTAISISIGATLIIFSLFVATNIVKWENVTNVLKGTI